MAVTEAWKDMDMKKVFLGGTCNGSAWRDELIPQLEIGWFNPVVDDWTEECHRRELEERENDDYCLYVLTPLMEGAYAVAEVVDDSNKRPGKTLMAYLEEDGGARFTSHQLKAMGKVAAMVEGNGGRSFDSLEAVAEFLNAQAE